MAGRHRKPPARRGSGRHRQPPPRRQAVMPALAAVVVLGAGGVGAAAAFGGDPAPAPMPRVAASLAPPTGPAPAVTSPAAGSPAADTATATAGTPSPDPPHGTAAAARSSRPAALVIAVPGRVSWVQVLRGPRVAFEGMLRHGHRLAYRHGPLAVTIGDAGAVRLVRDGHGHGRAGKPGEVLRLHVTR